MFNPAGGLSKPLTVFVWIVYVVVGLLLGILGIVALVFYNESGHDHPMKFITVGRHPGYTGFQPHATPIIILVCFLILAAFFLAVSMFLRGVVIKDESYYNGLFQGLGKFAPIPLLLFIAMILIPIAEDSDSDPEDEVIVGMVFSIIVVIFLFIIYFKSNFGDKIFGFFIKKVLYSGILVLSFFYFWHSVIQETSIDEGKTYGSGDTLKALSIVFQIIFSICVGLFVFFFVDIVAGVFGILIEIAVLANMTKFKTGKWAAPKRYKGDCAVSGILFILLAIVTVLTAILKKDKILK